MTTAGKYIFKLIVTDNHSKSSNGSMTVTVEPEAAKAPPTVNAGANQTITLPINSATLTGKATGNDGAVVNSYFWVFMSGPSWVKFSNEWEPTTTVSGLVAGTYTFELSASDNNYETSTSTMTLVVKPKASVAAATGTTVQTGNAAAVTGNAAAVTDPSVADSISHVVGLVIYPNPVHDLLNIHLNNESTGKITLAIFNTRGTRIQSLELEKGAWSLETSVDVSKLATGVYLIEVISGPHLRTIERFIKQ
jgi:hypothetical protein